MRKIVAGLFATLDGVVEAPDRWMGEYWCDEMGAAIAEGIRAADAILLGKDTYLQFAEMWQPQGDTSPMAAFLNNTPKYVVSSTLTELTWPGSTLLTGDLVDAVTELKSREGRNIQVPGSPRLVRWLLAQGLLDELALNILPLVAGTGLRLFDDVDKEIPLRLESSTAVSTGVLGAVYVPA